MFGKMKESFRRAKSLLKRRMARIISVLLLLLFVPVLVYSAYGAIAWRWEYSTNPTLMDAYLRNPLFAQAEVTSLTAGSVTLNSGALTMANTSSINVATVELTNAEIKALATTSKELIAAPGSGYFIEVIQATLILDYGSNALTAGSSDDLVIEYGGGQDITGTIESTSFITATADTLCLVQPAGIANVAASNIVNKAVQLTNTGSDFAGNAGNDTTMTVLIAYRTHATGL